MTYPICTPNISNYETKVYEIELHFFTYVLERENTYRRSEITIKLSLSVLTHNINT